MNTALTQLAQFLGTGWLHDHVVNGLRTIPGFPPIVQSVHILSIACVMASIVMIDLRILGLAVPSQSPAEMVRRLSPWLWTALILLFLSGVMFVMARPRRYFANPIFGFKFAFLFVAIVVSIFVLRMQRKTDTVSGLTKSLAALSLLAWLGVVLAGRWIAYADYLIAPE